MPRLRMCAAVLAVASTALLTNFVAGAEASRAPSSQDRAGLTSAVYASSVGGINRIPRSRYRVTGQRVSTVSNYWGIAQITAAPAFRSTFQGAIVVAVRLAGTHKWVVVDLGTADVGCGIAPNTVLSDLFSTKTPCPSEGGIG